MNLYPLDEWVDYNFEFEFMLHLEPCNRIKSVIPSLCQVFVFKGIWVMGVFFSWWEDLVENPTLKRWGYLTMFLWYIGYSSYCQLFFRLNPPLSNLVSENECAFGLRKKIRIWFKIGGPKKPEIKWDLSCKSLNIFCILDDWFYS